MMRGFTLIETLIVLAILAVLVAMVSLAVGPVIAQANTEAAQAEFEAVSTALVAFKTLDGIEGAVLPEREAPAVITEADSDAPFKVYLNYLPTRFAYAWTLDGVLTQLANDTVQALTPLGSTPQEISTSILALMTALYDETGHWARSWSPYSYTDLGLDADVWGEAIGGIRYGPNSAYLGLANVSGDEYQVYVQTIDGVEMHLIDSWNIWISALDGRAYYHLKPEGQDPEDIIEVDPSTIEVRSE